MDDSASLFPKLKVNFQVIIMFKKKMRVGGKKYLSPFNSKIVIGRRKDYWGFG